LSSTNYKGDWNEYASYSTGDTVTREGIFYRAKLDNTGKDPVLYSDYWVIPLDVNSIVGISEALNSVRALENELQNIKERIFMQGEAEISASDDSVFFHSSDPYIQVVFPYNLPSSDYFVDFEVISATPTSDFTGNIYAENKAQNGFILRYTGSASYAKIKWTLHFLNI
jgi:hypothetical protein